MRVLLVILSVLLISGSLFAATGEGETNAQYNPISPYKPNYLIFGDFTDQVKAEVSFKYNPFYPYKPGVYFAYSQTMFWNLYSLSNPFSDITFNPEIFWQFESGNNFANNVVVPVLDYLRLGLYEHKSNGKDGTNSRSIDQSYIQAQLSVGDFINFGINGKYFYMWMKESQNQDIQDYIGSFEGMIFLKLVDHKNKIDQEMIYAKLGFGGGVNQWDITKGWQEYGIKSRAFFSRVRVYGQCYFGYAESMLHYNRQDFSLRIGAIFE